MQHHIKRFRKSYLNHCSNIPFLLEFTEICVEDFAERIQRRSDDFISSTLDYIEQFSDKSDFMKYIWSTSFQLIIISKGGVFRHCTLKNICIKFKYRLYLFLRSPLDSI